MIWRTLLCCALSVCVTAGCSDKKDQQPPAETGNPPPTEVKDDVQKPTTSSADVTFLVDGCIEVGYSAEQCACVGKIAASDLGGELVAKMEKAPKKEKELEGYYSGAEIQQTMKFVDKVGSECGLDEEAG